MGFRAEHGQCNACQAMPSLCYHAGGAGRRLMHQEGSHSPPPTAPASRMQAVHSLTPGVDS